MPDRMHMLDTAYPNFSGGKSTEDKVTAIQNYLFMLMEELRYLLRHLDAENFTDAGLEELAEGVAEAAERSGDGALERFVTDSLLNNTELTEDRLSTSRRIRKFLLGDTSDEDFIRVREQTQSFITATVKSATHLLTEEGLPLLTESGLPITEELGNAATAQAVNRFGQALYWQREPAGHTEDGFPLDREGKLIFAAAAETPWPVTVYQYTELVKAELAFAPLDGESLPQLVFGTGDVYGSRRGYVYKDETGLRLRYVTGSRRTAEIVFGEEGFVDADHRRLASCRVDTEAGEVRYGLEGSDERYRLTFTQDGDAVTFRWPDGFECEVSVT